MAGLGLIIFIVVIVMALRAAGGNWSGLLKKGIPARGILLAVAANGMAVREGGNALERRRVVLDIEIPGEPPYEARLLITFPANMRSDVLPGATVELRVAARNRKNVAIVGPGAGFAFAAAAPPPLAAAITNQRSA
jgi:hypothetical protein